MSGLLFTGFRNNGGGGAVPSFEVATFSALPVGLPDDTYAYCIDTMAVWKSASWHPDKWVRPFVRANITEQAKLITLDPSLWNPETQEFTGYEVYQTGGVRGTDFQYGLSVDGTKVRLRDITGVTGYLRIRSEAVSVLDNGAGFILNNATISGTYGSYDDRYFAWAHKEGSQRKNITLSAGRSGTTYKLIRVNSPWDPYATFSSPASFVNEHSIEAYFMNGNCYWYVNRGANPTIVTSSGSNATGTYTGTRLTWISQNASQNITADFAFKSAHLFSFQGT